MPGQHAKLSPSSSSRWLTCTKSPEETVGCENKSSAYAEEGTLAHSLLELRLNPNAEQVDANDITVEMSNAVNEAYDYVQARMKEDAGSMLFTEMQVKATQLGPDVWGTADVIIWQPGKKNLIVADYKHGKGVSVEVEGNTQLQIYALGAMASLEWMLDGLETVETVVMQPRAFHNESTMRTEQYHIDDLNSVADVMRGAVEVIASGRGEYAPSESACRWCPAKHKCPALKDTVDAVVPFTAIPTKADIKEVVAGATDQQLLDFHEAMPLIKTWITAMEAHLVSRLTSGHAIDGLKVVAGRSNRRWKNPEDVERALKEEVKLRKNEMYEQKLISPTKVEKILKDKPKRGRAAKLAAFAAMVEKPQGKPTVVKESDKRESLAPAAFETLE